MVKTGTLYYGYPGFISNQEIRYSETVFVSLQKNARTVGLSQIRPGPLSPQSFPITRYSSFHYTLQTWSSELLHKPHIKWNTVYSPRKEPPVGNGQEIGQLQRLSGRCDINKNPCPWRGIKFWCHLATSQTLYWDTQLKDINQCLEQYPITHKHNYPSISYNKFARWC